MLHWTEEERLAALAEHDLLDTPPEEVFDALTQAAARACGAPMAAVTLLAEERQWFKSRIGLDLEATPREDAFCNHTIRGGDSELMVVPDAALDPRFADNPLVTDAPKLRFYAGAPIRSADGRPLGALCVLDTRPHPQGLGVEQAFLLRTLADQVSEQLKLRRIVDGQRSLAREQAQALAATREREGRLARALDTGAVGWWEWDVATGLVRGDAELALSLGRDAALALQGIPLSEYLELVDALDRPLLEDAIQACVVSGELLNEEYRLNLADGRVRWVVARGRCLYDAEGRPSSFPGVLIDITSRKDAEARLREADMGRELALRAARLGRWDYRPAAQERYVDPRARELLFLLPDQTPDVPTMLERLHPGDRARLAAAAARALDASRAGPFRETFRLVDPESGAVRWVSAYGASQFENGACTRFLGVLADVTAEQTAAEHRALLAGELNHRVKNTMALVMSVVMTSLRGSTDAGLRDAIAERLVSLGRAHDLLTSENWSAATAPAIVDGMVETLSLPRERLELSGPALRLGPKPALHLALALHELATNAIKYGALSNDVGRIRVTWGVEPGPDGKVFHFGWSERGGPPVDPPRRSGFGTRLIQRATAAEFGGASTLDYAPTGVVWRLTAPLEGLAELGRLAFEEAAPASRLATG